MEIPELLRQWKQKTYPSIQISPLFTLEDNEIRLLWGAIENITGKFTEKFDHVISMNVFDAKEIASSPCAGHVFELRDDDVICKKCRTSFPLERG